MLLLLLCITFNFEPLNFLILKFNLNPNFPISLSHLVVRRVSHPPPFPYHSILSFHYHTSPSSSTTTHRMLQLTAPGHHHPRPPPHHATVAPDRRRVGPLLRQITAVLERGSTDADYL